MSTRNKPQSSRNGGVSDFIWNLIGGAMVSAMIAGVVYVLVGSLGTYFAMDDKYWELIYLKWFFITAMICYLVMPTLVANLLTAPFKSNSKATGKKI